MKELLKQKRGTHLTFNAIRVLKKNVLTFCLGVIHKGCPHRFGYFWDPPSPSSGLSTFGWPPPAPSSPCPCRHKAGIIWNIATCEQFTLKGKNWSFWYWMYTRVFLLDNFDNSIPKDGVDHEVNVTHRHDWPNKNFYILYWIQAEWKFYIQAYCQIIWVNFTNIVPIIFFLSGRPHFANHPSPSPCPHLPTFAWPPWNFKSIAFIWTQTYREIFKSTLLYL